MRRTLLPLPLLLTCLLTIAATPAAPELNERDRVVDLVNAERTAAGCGPVHVDERLAAAAQEHSQDMAEHDYLSHESPEGEGPRERADRHGYPHLVAETVARGQQSAERVVETWMASDRHRDIILNCDRVAVGVGEVDRAWTQKLGSG